MNLDPRTKLVIIICISTLALIYNTPGCLLLLFAGMIMLLLIFQVRIIYIWGSLRKLLPLVLTLFLLQAVFLPGGKTLLSIGHIPLLTEKGLAAGASVVLRLGIICTIAVLLTSSVNSRDFVTGLVQWKVPYRIAFMVYVTMRFLPILRDDMSNMVTAVQLRGVDLKKVPWREKIGLYRCMFFPLVYGAILKAQQLSLSMEARCFRIYPRRTYLRRLNFTAVDYGVIAAFLTVTLVLIIIHLYYPTEI